MLEHRFSRNELLFGRDGQQKLRDLRVVVVGAGGLGGHVIQQLAYLGVGHMTIIDGEALDVTNKNRYVTALHMDPNEGFLKVDAARRLINGIDPNIGVTTVAHHFPDINGLQATARAGCVIGCVDDDNARFMINEIAASYDRLYIDCATEILMDSSLRYGGRVVVSRRGMGCLVCRELLDTTEVADGFRDDAQIQDRQALYGLSQGDAIAGPSVVSINAVVASLAVTELLVATTGLRLPLALQTYRADRGTVTVNADPADEKCFYCHGLRSGSACTDLERYVVLKRRSVA